MAILDFFTGTLPWWAVATWLFCMWTIVVRQDWSSPPRTGWHTAGRLLGNFGGLLLLVQTIRALAGV